MEENNFNKHSLVLSPLNIRFSFLFVSLFTALLALISFFPESTFIQWIRIHTTPDTGMVMGFIPFSAWFTMALFVGMYVPLLMLILYQFRKWVSELLLPYLIVFVIQIITELIVTNILFPGFALVIGIIYTAYRIWQLQTAISIHNQRVIQEERANVFLQNFLMLAAGFWMVNLLFLLSTVVT